MNDDLEPHSVRITTHGKLRSWVKFALEHFESHPTKPLLLHTRSQTHDSAVAVIPRLISVAEIIKREYLKRARERDRDGPSWSGLHQYNEIICLDGAPMHHDIAAALQGKNFPKQKQAAVMTITLCPQPLPHLEEKGATYQLPLTAHLSKAAKARMRRRKAKSLGAAS